MHAPTCSPGSLQNIIIAIVGEAYKEAKQKEGPVELTLAYTLWLRLKFSLIYVWRVWIQRLSVEDFVETW